ncbi:hypothetical protein TorRG33x02_298070 [Trema orientale]|uniref:Uncharacterized protein n=1 Tax=Trema orientale TaxID=63057 RepID=A0A2P5C4E4_TREOI|nr:hypothetical protein TorRG33x02_298070 [Trema orientale]
MPISISNQLFFFPLYSGSDGHDDRRLNNVNRRAQLGSFLDAAWSNDENVHNEQWNYSVLGIKQILVNRIVSWKAHAFDIERESGHCFLGMDL